jgi:PKD repeat protein
MGGPAYRFDAKVAKKPGSTAWPQYYDGVPLFYEWTRDYIKAFFTSNSDLTRIEPAVGTLDFDNPMDLEFGPDGSLYVLEYGDGFFGKNLPGAELARVDFNGPTGNKAPSVTANADTTEGAKPLTVHFNALASDPEGTRLRYEWDFDADGKVDSKQANPAFTFTADGLYRATVKVTDQGGRSASDYVEVIVGRRPVVHLTVTDLNGAPFHFGDTVRFDVEVDDDQPVDCNRVSVTYVLGHDQHGHPITTAFGCTGTITTSVPSGHNPATDNLRAVFDAQYTDTGNPPLTGTAEVVLNPAP